MARLVIVSNRVSLPTENSATAGGLAVALKDALAKRGGVWFGWSGKVADSRPGPPAVTVAGNTTYVTTDLSQNEYENYYVGHANATLWPLFHYRPGLVRFRRKTFDGYLKVNTRFAALLAPLIKPGDQVWIHDYHFMVLASELRRLGVSNRIGFFLHIPLPACELLATIPGHQRLIEGLLSCDLVGFQTAHDLKTFRDYVVYEAAGRVGPGDLVSAMGQQTRAQVFPIGIDAEDFSRMAETAATSPESERLRASVAGRPLIIGVDRLDYSKGLIERMTAFEQLLNRWPAHQAAVTYMQVAPPSRGEVPAYRALRSDLESSVGRINAQFARFDWVPIRLLVRAYHRANLAGFLRQAQVGLVTPLRDGMNLVAKEFVAAQDPADPGVLVLSRFAGAAEELDGALVVNPFDQDQVVEALHLALTMPLDQRQTRWRTMIAAVRQNTVSVWRNRFLAALSATPERPTP
ncbi:MAG: alpha,alpha-trehalose-phosphate synthase (UDP-forming) [Azospirillum sp.]|nr:alpha,alpha-trehalose-phosphate synthase (UDP-forming) [Azospirillum sp.]